MYIILYVQFLTGYGKYYLWNNLKLKILILKMFEGVKYKIIKKKRQWYVWLSLILDIPIYNIYYV